MSIIFCKSFDFCRLQLATLRMSFYFDIARMPRQLGGGKIGDVRASPRSAKDARGDSGSQWTRKDRAI
jgi:hypothetical protein